MDQVPRDWQREALVNEDKGIVEGIEAHRDVARRYGLKPAMLACDEAAVRVSRDIDRLVLREAA